MPRLIDLPNRQVWVPDTHPEALHTAWHSDDPDTQLCIGVHVHPQKAGRHFRATPAELRLPGHRHAITGAGTHRIPDDHEVVLDFDHAGRIYEAIRAENRLKNLARETVVKAMPDWAKRQTDHNGQPVWYDPDDEALIVVAPGRYFRIRDGAAVFTEPGSLRAEYMPLPHFEPRWGFDAETGRVNFMVPGLTVDEHAALHEAVQAAHGPDVSAG